MWAHLLGQRLAHGLLLHMAFLSCLPCKHPFPSFPFRAGKNHEMARQKASPAWVTWWKISPMKPDGRDLGVSASRHPVGDVTSIGGSSSYDWQNREREAHSMNLTEGGNELSEGNSVAEQGWESSWKTMTAQALSTQSVAGQLARRKQRSCTWQSPQAADLRGDPLDSDRAPGAQPWPGPEAAEGSEPGEAARCCHRFSRDQRELQPERLCSSHPPRPPPADWGLRNPAQPFPLSPHSPAPHSLPLTSTFYCTAERVLNLTVTQSLASSVVTAPQESIPTPSILSCSSLAFSDSPACVPSHFYKGRRERKASRGQRAPELHQETDELLGFGRWCVWLWAISTDSCLGTSVVICRRSWVPPMQKPNATCCVRIGAMRMQRIGLSWLLQTYWVMSHSLSYTHTHIFR